MAEVLDVSLLLLWAKCLAASVLWFQFFWDCRDGDGHSLQVWFICFIFVGPQEHDSCAWLVSKSFLWFMVTDKGEWGSRRQLFVMSSGQLTVKAWFVCSAVCYAKLPCFLFAPLSVWPFNSFGSEVTAKGLKGLHKHPLSTFKETVHTKMKIQSHPHKFKSQEAPRSQIWLYLHPFFKLKSLLLGCAPTLLA